MTEVLWGCSGAVIISISQMRKRRPKKGKSLLEAVQLVDSGARTQTQEYVSPVSLGLPLGSKGAG